MSVRIYTDFAADFSEQELEDYHINRFSMPLMCDDTSYEDGSEFPLEEFWQRLTSGSTVKTSQPTPDSFLTAFSQAKEAGDEILCILIASALSGTVHGATVAAQMAEYPHIYIVDSGQAAASCAQKLLVLQACRLRDQGLGAEQIAQQLQDFSSRVFLFACVDTLEYLARGGRISPAVASIGNLAQIKPIITLAPGGSIKVAAKALGRGRALKTMTDLVASHPIDPQYPGFMLYADTPAPTQEFLERLKKAKAVPKGTTVLNGIGPTIGTYIGPNAYGIAFVEKR